jgi:hypothetical protein
MIQVGCERVKDGEEVIAVGIAEEFSKSRMKRRGAMDSFKKRVPSEFDGARCGDDGRSPGNEVLRLRALPPPFRQGAALLMTCFVSC